MTRDSFIRIAGLDELHGDGPHALSANEFDIAAVHTPSGWRVFEGHCPHQGALLGEGELDGDKLVCRNHRWRFSVESGQREDGPECLFSCPVIEQDRALFVDISKLSRQATSTVATRTLEDLPGPPALPFVGNTHQLNLKKLHLNFEHWAARYGPVYLIRRGSVPMVVISDPVWSNQVLRSRPEAFRRDSSFHEIFSEMGIDGVFSAEGSAWRRQRKLVMSALAQRHLHGLYPKLQTVAARLKKRWEMLAEAGTPVDIVAELQRFTVDVTTLITFGHDVNSVEKGDDIIQRKLELVFPEFIFRLFALIPLWRFIRLPKDRRLDRALSELRAWLSRLVAAERARLAAEPERAAAPSNLLEAMVSARDEEGRPFRDEVIFGNLMTMLLGGEDTTAYTLSWAIHELCQSKEWVSELRQEADALFPHSDVPGNIEIAHKLARAGAVANETMRLRPVAPIAAILEANFETVVGDVRVPAGTRVVVLSRPAACSADHFAEAQSFRPGRWLGEAEGAHDLSAHIPFGSGPRICPGRSLALLEMKLLLAMLYKNFDVERLGKTEDVTEVFAFTMFPVGLNVRLHRRHIA
ncbi:MAG: cytochrome P450 [Methylocapsa sp.]|nr:cytochrome P450 [Methylocapsa sp.]